MASVAVAYSPNRLVSACNSSRELLCVQKLMVIRSSSSMAAKKKRTRTKSSDFVQFSAIRCCSKKEQVILRTCKNCKSQFDPLLNDPRACRFHSAHFGGETKRKFESVYSGGTMSTPESGKVFQYWHCCGSEDPFDPGCTASPHSSYDD